MTSLVLSRFRPDRPAGGAAIRNCQNIRSLSMLGPVDVASIGVTATVERVAAVRAWAAFPVPSRSLGDRLRSRVWPLRPRALPMIDTYYCRDALAWILDRAARYDVVLVEGIALAPYVRDLKRAGCRVVFDAHNVESALYAHELEVTDRPDSVLHRWASQIALRRLVHLEHDAVTSADVVWACSEQDAAEIESEFRPALPVTVVPNAVDVDLYRRASTSRDADWATERITLMYPGLFSYTPNEHAALALIREVLPALRARGRRARVMLVGRDPTQAMLAAARQDQDVSVTGEVESVLPYLEQPCVIALPIRVGGGTRLKILEAFAAGRPVVSTAKGADGIDASDGEHLLVREDADAIAEGVIDAWDRPALRNQLCRNALALVRRRYSAAVAAERVASSLVGESASAEWRGRHPAAAQGT